MSRCAYVPGSGKLVAWGPEFRPRGLPEQGVPRGCEQSPFGPIPSHPIHHAGGRPVARAGTPD